MKGITAPWFQAAPAGVQTRWISPENPTGAKGQGALSNKGGKGNAFYVVAPGATQTLLDLEGPGIIQRMWSSGTIGLNPVQRRAVRLDMYWDHAEKPAVSVPFGDFFGLGLGVTARYDNALFSNPEGRSFNATVPMPFHQAARMTITNESDSEVWIWYDINVLLVPSLPKDTLYFHAYWNRDPATTPGVDYEILPGCGGQGRYLGANLGVIGNPVYQGSWFGEGEVKIYLDGDENYPTLVGTGTEDYIGTGWGQGEYCGRYFGSLLSNKEHDLYAFYRYHLPDPVFFHEHCRVTIQMIGNATKPHIRTMQDRGAEITPIWFLDHHNGKSVQRRLLDEAHPPRLSDDDFPVASTNFYRSDDVSATAYFYLDRPCSNLPELPDRALRLQALPERVFRVVEGSAPELGAMIGAADRAAVVTSTRR